VFAIGGKFLERKETIMSIRNHLKPLFLYTCIIAVFGCSSVDPSVGSYSSSAVYNKPLFSKITMESVAYEGPLRNPVIVIPGFLGTKLKDTDTGEIVWGKFKGNEIIKGFSNKQLKDLSHPIDYKRSLKEMKGNVKAFKLLERVKVVVLGVQFEVAAYSDMMYILNEGGYVQKEQLKEKKGKIESLFTFYYDWRRDNVETAAKLHKFILGKRKYLQQQYEKVYGVKNYDIKFDIIAHSMGGLIARYYLRYGDQDIPKMDRDGDSSLPKLDWRGAKYVDRLFVVGTPNAGYLDACMELINGLQINPRLPAYPPAVIGTFPSYYQMMPLASTNSVYYKDDSDGTSINMFKPETWIKMKWGLADPRQDKILKILLPEIELPIDRRRIALDHLKKCLARARKFTESLRVRSNPPGTIDLYLFLGDAVETSRKAVVDRKTGKITVSEYDAGDGKVLTSSAYMDEREGQKWIPYRVTPIKWNTVVRLNAAHMGITKSYPFADNLAHYLLNWPPSSSSRK